MEDGQPGKLQKGDSPVRNTLYLWSEKVKLFQLRLVFEDQLVSVETLVNITI